VDHYGNLVTNVSAERGIGRGVRLAGVEVAPQRTYADVEDGALLAYVGAFGLLEVAARGDSAAERLGIGRGAAVTLHPA
jgi:S-adenosylmethionine hydrolase